jgi:hypothetical protein
MRGAAYDYVSAQASMNEHLVEQLGCGLTCHSDHEWDAALSALVAYRYASGQWQLDLHSLPVTSDERLVRPCGLTKYAWPD